MPIGHGMVWRLHNHQRSEPSQWLQRGGQNPMDGTVIGGIGHDQLHDHQNVLGVPAVQYTNYRQCYGRAAGRTNHHRVSGGYGLQQQQDTLLEFASTRYELRKSTLGHT